MEGLQLGGPSDVLRQLQAECAVEYLTLERLEDHRVEVRGGRLFWACDATPLDSTGLPGMSGDEDDLCIFILAPDGRLYAGQGLLKRFHHSSFLSGTPVLTDTVSKLPPRHW